MGIQAQGSGKGLVDFAGFLQKEHASYITVPLALKWAQQTSSTRPAEWARRLNFIRGFARYRRATDPRTEILPWGLLPFRPERARPYLYTDDEVRRLLKAALRLSPEDALRRWTYHVLLGLLAVSGIRISGAEDDVVRKGRSRSQPLPDLVGAENDRQPMIFLGGGNEWHGPIAL
jgi:hypothetical protein